jgi:integrase
MYFCGLRPGEARAVRWEDYNGKTLRVRASIWRTYLTEPKTAESAASVPVAATLATILNVSRRDSGYILAGQSGKPVSLHNLARRIVAPALKKAGIPWHGWYALRRGIATLATSVESPLAAKGLLRHANLATTQAHYIKDVPSETIRAMEKIDALCNNAGTASERRH